LIYRFYEPQRGYITINDIPLTAFTISSLREQFGIVQQEPVLFNSSVMENIRYGKSHASAQEIKKAAETANVTEFIEKEELYRGSENSLEISPISDDPRYEQLHRGYRMI